MILSIHLSLGSLAQEKDYLFAERLCHSYGFRVVSTDRDKAEQIPENYLEQCDAVIANLSKYEAGEPDPGVIFDLGMAFSRKKLLYGYSKDLRSHIHRYPYAHYGPNGELLDQYGLVYATALTPGNLMYTVPTKMVEGPIDQCIKTVYYDAIEQAKERGQRIVPRVDLRHSVRHKSGEEHCAYLAGFECFHLNERELGTQMVALCKSYGIDAVFPTSPIRGWKSLSFEEEMSPWIGISYYFDRDQYKVQTTDIIIANFNPYHGLVPDSGTAFELGMAVGLGHYCVAFYSADKDSLWSNIPEKHNWPVDPRSYDPEAYGRRLRAMFKNAAIYLSGTFEEAVRAVRLAINRSELD